MKEDYLEIIKQNEPKQVWDQEDGDFYLLFVPEMWDKVIDAAKKMEAELALKPDVVFCKDCRSMQKGDQIDPERLTCVHGAIVEPHDYCSMGKRKDK